MNNLIADHPAGVFLVFSLMWGALIVLGALVVRFARREFKRIEDKELEQDGRLVAIEDDIRGEDSRLAILARDLQAHIADEAETKKTVKLTHEAVLRIGNGQMVVLSNKLDTIKENMARVEGKVDGHNSEAEGWKRRIEKNELRLDHLEGGKR